MFKSHFINGNAAQKFLFKNYSNKLTKIKAISKSLFYKNELSKNNNDPKKVWNLIRFLIPPNKKSSNSTNQEVNLNPNLTEKFHDFFCAIGEKLANIIPTQNPLKFKTFLKHRISSSLFLEPPNLYEIIDMLRAIKMNKAVGHDDLPAYYLKIVFNVIAPYLQPLIHFAFTSGIFPDHCKIAKIIPLHKQGNTDDPSNYRPISILPCSAKIFEKLLHKRLIKFFTKHNEISPTQYDFQENISTTHAIHDILTASYDNICEKLYTGSFFLDLKKAIDSSTLFASTFCYLNLTTTELEAWHSS